MKSSEYLMTVREAKINVQQCLGGVLGFSNLSFYYIKKKDAFSTDFKNEELHIPSKLVPTYAGYLNLNASELPSKHFRLIEGFSYTWCCFVKNELC